MGRKQFKTFLFTFIYSFLVFDCQLSFGQQSKIDSLESLLSVTHEDSTKVKILKELFRSTLRSDAVSALSYAQKALELSKQNKYDKGIADSYCYIGVIHFYQAEYIKALDYYKKSLEIRETIKDRKGIADAYVFLGAIYKRQGDDVKALEYYIKSLKAYDIIGEKSRMGLSFQNIGTIYHEQTKYSLALEHYKKALIIFEKYRDKHKIAVTSSNIGAVYANIGENELANTYYIKSLEIKKELGDKVGQAYTFNNIGKSYAMQDKNEKAIEFHMKALNIQMSISDKSGESFSLMSIGNLNFKQGEITLALEYLKRSLKLSLEIGAKKEVQLSYRSISLIYDRINDYQNAYKYHKLYTGTKDSLFNETSSKQLTEMQTKYETEKKENEINLLTKEKEIQDLEINKNKTVQVALISVLVLVSLLGFLIHNRYRIKTKSNELLSEKNNELEQSREEIRAQNVELGQINQLLDNKNKNITNSINYAQRIQETIMPTKKNLERIFPESFIFFKAKDVVSGDFPFIAQVGDDIFVSAVDCTGHGVPEAMMSMIGYFLLNDIINGRNILQPDVILNELHKGVLATLNQKENLESRDGMDIAFCKINTKKMTVDYAGAHRPLLVSNNGDLKEIRGDRFPIGGTFYSSRGKDIKFTNHSISLNRGDTILLYSDGLPDQQGGSKEKSKSFGNRQIKKIVTENKNKKMADMHKIFQERFDVWCGKGNQLDDVLLIGIRMT